MASGSVQSSWEGNIAASDCRTGSLLLERVGADSAANKGYRGTTILPGRTGPVPDVLYSAAGNSADALWYNNGIYAWDFEVGADLWNAQERKWEPVGFQPPFEEGHEEAMEFANGLIGMLDVAYDYEHDKKAPTSKLHVKRSMENATLEFSTSEPATIYYTTNNKRPTFSSKK